jgi:hypothetical protein
MLPRSKKAAMWERRSLPQNGSSSTKKNGDPNTPRATAASFASMTRCLTAMSCIAANASGAVMPQRRSDIGGGIGIGSTFAAEPIFSICRASIIRAARRIVAVEPVEDSARRQRVLGPAAVASAGSARGGGRIEARRRC